jgi:putative transcriptional regulator|tara:strand:+ start:891 stop:1118 length:228 start_codon:yes stop_codon:yes gene_type:complete
MKKIEQQISTQRDALAETLFQMRLKHGLSQLALANKAGVDRKTVNRIECGHFSPSLDTLVRLSKVLSVEPAKLLG